MPQIISSGVIPQWIARMQAPSREFPEYTGVGEPPEYSLDLDQLQSIISTGNPQLMGFYREGITSKQQERTKLQDRLQDTTLSDIEKLQIDKQIQSIDDVIGEPGKEFSDSDVANMIIRGEPDLQRKLKSYVPASYGEPGSLPAVLGKSMGMMFKELPSKVTPFLTSIARNMTLPKTPYQRRMYEVGRNMELQRADKVRGLLETRNRDDNQEQYDAWEKELAEVDDYLASHPEWKDENRYPPKESFTPFELKFEDAMLKVEDAARQDLEKVSLMDTETLAYYKWVQQQNMRSFMDGRGFQAKTFMHHLGQGLASFAPAAAAGFATGVVTKSPTAGLTVGRTVMGVMEGSDQYNQAMQYAQENGLDIEEARQLALGTGVTYGVGSAWMEGIAPGMFMKRLGLMVDKPIKSMLRKSLFGRINKSAVNKYAAAKVISGKALDQIPFFLIGAGVEGLQELSQYLYQVGIQADYMDEGGDNYLDRYMNVYDVSEAATSAYAGAVTGGVLGGISGVVGKPGTEAEAVVEAAEAERKKISGKVDPIAFELPTAEVEYGDNPTQDYLIRLSDVKKEQLSPESVEEGASPLDISIYEKKGAKSSVDKLFGLIERVGASAVKEISGLSDDDKSSLLTLVRGKVNQETPEVNLENDEDALKFLNAFAQGGKRVETSKRIDLGAPQVVVETKFDPKAMPVSAQKDIADLGFPTTIFESPPKIPTVAPAIPEAPPISFGDEETFLEEPPIVDEIPEPKEMPEPKEPTLEQVSKMAAAKKPEVAKVTPEDVHKAAEAVGMAWDDDADFMALSKRVTGKDRIDDMTSDERSSLIAEISKEDAVKKPTKVTKIISGGQIGADEFGLEVGKELDIETGGTAPPEFQTSDGKQPEKLKGYGLVAGAKDPKVYRKRTIKNVKDADGTVIFGDLDSSGSKLTVNSAKANKKPYITNPTATELSDWIDKNNIKTLNVAGNRNIDADKVKPILKEALGIQPPAVKVPAVKQVEPEMTEKQFDVISEALSIHKVYENDGGETTLVLEDAVKEGIISNDQVTPILKRIKEIEESGQLGETGLEYRVWRKDIQDIWDAFVEKQMARQAEPPVAKPPVIIPSGPVKQVKAEKPKGTSTKGIKDIKFKVEGEDKIYAAQDGWPTISEEPELYDKILKRLVKRLPFVKPGLLADGFKLSFEREKDFPHETAKVLGRSVGMSVQWLKDDAPIDTPPHEFFHSFFRLY